MARPSKRYPNQPPLSELRRVRRALYPAMKPREFAAKLGITRLHLTAVESGRRRPSLDLALRWLELLAPQARMDMFGDVPTVREHVRLFNRLQQVSPQTLKAA